MRALVSAVVVSTLLAAIDADARGGIRRKVGDGSWVNQQWDDVDVPLVTRALGVRARFAADIEGAQLVASKRWLVMWNERQVLVQGPRTHLRPLTEHIPLPPEIDYFTSAAFTSDVWLLLGAGTYPRDRADAEAKTKGPGAGPTHLELLAVNLETGRLVRIPEITLRSWPPAAAATFSGALSDRIVPFRPLALTVLDDAVLVGTPEGVMRVEPRPEGKFHDRRALAGHLLRFADPKVGHAAPTQLDGAVMCVVQEPGQSFIERRRGDEVTTYDLGAPDTELAPTQIMKHGPHLLVAHARGLVELDEENKRHVFYRTRAEGAEPAVRRLELIGGDLYGARPDGLLRFELERKRATLFQLDGCSSDVTDVIRFAGSWLVATRERVCRVTDLE